MFEFVKELDCVPVSPVFHHLVASMMSAINSQARASFSASTFLRQIRRETLVSHLPAATHASIKNALLSSPSSSTLFSKEVVRSSLTQVKEDSQLSLLSNLSSKKDGKKFSSASSSSGRGSSSYLSYCGSSRPFQGTKRSYLPSPHRKSVSFDSKNIRSPKSKKSAFRK